MTEFTITLAGFILTLLIYSYLVGDNPLYRLAVHLLVGVTAAYAAVIAVQDVIIPLARRMTADPSGNILWIVPLVFALLLLLSGLRRVAWLADNSVGALVGIGAAVALVGAISGTLIPQLIGGGETPLIAGLVAVLTVLALAYFQFTGKANADGSLAVAGWQRLLSAGGRFVLTIALAALFAGLLATSLSLLVERVSFFVTWILGLFGVPLP